MKGYCSLYLKSDVLLSCDVFQKIRSACLEYFALDHCHYFSNIELSRNATLKMADVNLELILHTDMFQIIEKGMRGGISYISQKYIKANIEFVEYCDKNELSKYVKLYSI